MSQPPIPTLGEIVKRIRDTCPFFERRVGGTSAFASTSVADEKTAENADIKTPYAFLMPLAEVTPPRHNAFDGQRVTEAIGIIVCFNNAVNRDADLGLMAADYIRVARQELLNSLLNWRFGAFAEMSYKGGRHMSMNRARLWHQFEFQFSYLVSPADDGTQGTGLKQGAGPSQTEVFTSIYAARGINPNWDFLFSDKHSPVEHETPVNVLTGEPRE